MDSIVELLSQTERWVELHEVNKSLFDMSWKPDLREPPLYMYLAINGITAKLNQLLSIMYLVQKLENIWIYPVASTMAQMQYWTVNNNKDLNSFDFTW
jgi:hypothetical protein